MVLRIRTLSIGQMASFAAVIVPMGLINVVGSMQALESYQLLATIFSKFASRKWIGNIVAGILGSPYPTTLYIGHPGWKAIGARAGSLINGVLMAALCLTGSLGFLSEYVPIEAGMAILIWIGITIGAQAFQAVLGLMPG